MPYALEVPNEYGYVLLVATASIFVNQYHSLKTVQCRKESGIKYPTAYATTEEAEKNPAAHRFNCAQRAHANFTENLTNFTAALFTAGLRFPVPAAVAGATWLVGRVVYTAGYTSSKGPSGRMRGAAIAYLGYLPLIVMAGMTGVQMVRGL